MILYRAASRGKVSHGRSAGARADSALVCGGDGCPGERSRRGSRSTAKEGANAPRGRSGVRRVCEMSSGHREALEAYLERLGGDTAEPNETAVAALCGASAGEEDGVRMLAVSNMLRDDYTAFNHAAISYAALCEMGFRLYDPPLREIASRHLRAYAEATQQINQLIASVVAWELEQQGWSVAAYARCAAWGLAAARRPAPGR